MIDRGGLSSVSRQPAFYGHCRQYYKRRHAYAHEQAYKQLQLFHAKERERYERGHGEKCDERQHQHQPETVYSVFSAYLFFHSLIII